MSHVYPTPNPPQAKPPGATPTNHHPPLPKPAHTTVFMLLCRRVGGWEDGCKRGWEGGGEGGKGCARNGWCHIRVSPPLLPCSAEPPCSTVLDAECFGTWWCEHLAKEKEWGWLSVPCAPGWGLPNARPGPHGWGGENELWGVGEKTRWMRLEFDMRWDLSVLQ